VGTWGQNKKRVSVTPAGTSKRVFSRLFGQAVGSAFHPRKQGISSENRDFAATLATF
jgi:hypothetical protein